MRATPPVNLSRGVKTFLAKFDLVKSYRTGLYRYQSKPVASPGTGASGVPISMGRLPTYTRFIFCDNARDNSQLLVLFSRPFFRQQNPLCTVCGEHLLDIFRQTGRGEQDGPISHTAPSSCAPQRPLHSVSPRAEVPFACENSASEPFR